MAIINFISIQGSYNKLELAIFKNNKCLSLIREDNIKASSLLIPLITKILNENSLNISDIQFIAIDQGPGAFTSLRVAIATVNGISFANKIPLIGIDGLDALAQETLKNFLSNSNQTCPDILITLLNAYNNDVYFSINKPSPHVRHPVRHSFIDGVSFSDGVRLPASHKATQDTVGSINKGYKKIDILLDEIKKAFSKKTILFSGNGAQLHRQKIEQIFKFNSNFYVLQSVCSANQIASMALEKWNNKEDISFKLYPLYLKSQNFAIRSKPTKN